MSTSPTIDDLIRQQRARQADIARNHEASRAIWELECAERASYPKAEAHREHIR